MFNILIYQFYKSNTELRLVYTKSFNFKRNAVVKYIAKDTPRVAKVKYIKNNRTFFARIPNLSANLEETAKPCFSKKYFISFIKLIIEMQITTF